MFCSHEIKATCECIICRMCSMLWTSFNSSTRSSWLISGALRLLMATRNLLSPSSGPSSYTFRLFPLSLSLSLSPYCPHSLSPFLSVCACSCCAFHYYVVCVCIGYVCGACVCICVCMQTLHKLQCTYNTIQYNMIHACTHTHTRTYTHTYEMMDL